jgi:hypothetical protein
MMDSRVDPLDERTHPEVMDLMRQADFSEAVVLFGRLVKLAYSQGQIDAFASTINRLGPLETDVRAVAMRDHDA